MSGMYCIFYNDDVILLCNESSHEYAIFLSFSLIVSARANVGGPQFNNGAFCNQDLAILYSLRHVIVEGAIRGIRIEVVSVDLRQQCDD